MNYRKLEVWYHAVDLAVDIYEITQHFPHEEKYGLTSQMRRAAFSVPSNVAEGEGRWTSRDHLRFLGEARGSLYELDTDVVIASRVGYIADPTALFARIESQARLINGTISHVVRESRRRRMPPRRQ
jgi:four helix bundle protein